MELPDGIEAAEREATEQLRAAAADAGVPDADELRVEFDTTALLGVAPVDPAEPPAVFDDTRDEVRYPAWTERNADGDLPD